MLVIRGFNYPQILIDIRHITVHYSCVLSSERHLPTLLLKMSVLPITAVA